MTDTKSHKQTSWRVSLLGGLKQHGGRMPANTVVLTAVGGADLNLTDAELAPETTLTKISLAGGVNLRVPADADVDIAGFSLFGGRRVQPGTPSPSGPVIRVRACGLFGGVNISRA